MEIFRVYVISYQKDEHKQTLDSRYGKTKKTGRFPEFRNPDKFFPESSSKFQKFPKLWAAVQSVKALSLRVTKIVEICMQ